MLAIVPDTAISPATAAPLRLALVSASYGEGPQMVMPLGMMNIAAYVSREANQGNRPTVVARVFDFSDANPDDTSPLQALADWGADLVGFSVYSSHIHTVVAWARTIRAMLPDSLVFCGGPHVSLDAPHFTADWGDVFQLCITGEGEHGTARLIDMAVEHRRRHGSSVPLSAMTEDLLSKVPNAWWRDRNGVPRANPRELYQLPAERWANPLVEIVSATGRRLTFTDRSDNRIRNAVALTSSRGCPLTCSFCAIIAADRDGPRWRACTAEQLLGWLQEAYEREPFEHVYLMDANFFVKPDRVRSFAEGLHRGFQGRVTWSTSSTVGYLLRMADDLPVLKAHGLRLVELGIESGSQKQLDYLNKRVTVEKNVKAIHVLQEHGIAVGLDFIMFYPDQTVDEIRENLLFLLKARMTQQEVFDHYFNMLVLYPATPLRLEIEKRRKAPFDRNTLPVSRDIVADPRVAKIYALFIDAFAMPHIPRIEAAIDRVRRQLAELSKDGDTSSGMPSSRRQRAERRLDLAALRHIPFKVLWSLTEATDLSSLEAAVPDLADLLAVIDRVLAKGDAPTTMDMAPAAGTSGARGRSGELALSVG